MMIKSTLHRHMLVSVLVLAVAMLVPVLASAAPVVKTVPWVATNPLIAHDAYPGKAVTLKGTADMQGAGITYSWDFGDGSTPATGTVTNQYVIEASHAYDASLVGQTIAPTLTVTNNNVSPIESTTVTYLIAVKAQSLEVEANIAIDEGLWFLHKYFNRYSSGGIDYGSWLNCSGAYHCANIAALQGANVNAFFVNGHRVDGLASNPYTETVQRAMARYFELLSSGATPASKAYTAGSYGAALGTIDPDCTTCAAGDPSKNSRYVYQAGNDVYETGMMTAALAASGTPDAIAPTGIATYVQGRTYRAILQDLVDYWVFAQESRGSCSGFGGWRYSANYCNSDNSTAQWGAIGLMAAEGFGKKQYGASDPGIQIPQIVKDANKYWLLLNHSFQDLGGGNGRFGYDWYYSYAWGQWATTPSGLVQLAMDSLGRDGSDQKWEMTEQYLRANFGNTGGAGSAIKGYYYGLYAFVKAMLLHVNETTGLKEPITIFGGDLDWYAAEVSKGAPTDGVARTLINAQVGGGWCTPYGAACHYYSGDQYRFETTWAIQMLNRTVTESGAPVAVAKAVPNPAVAGGIVKLDGTGSFHQDPTKSIVKWEWDVGADGTIDFTGPVALWTAPTTLGNYNVKLTVTDNFGVGTQAATIITVIVDIPPLPPTANAGGPYNFCPGSKPWFLDGSGSVNPDEGAKDPTCGSCPGDTIATYAWDLNIADPAYDIANNKTPDVTTYFTNKGVGQYLVKLKVTDTTSLSFPGHTDLSSTSDAEVNVLAITDPKCSCTVLTSRAAGRQVQLTWTDVAAPGYSVYRSETDGGPYTRIAGPLPGTQLMYIDSGLTVGKTYYWVIRAVALDLEETCQSNQKSARIAGR